MKRIFTISLAVIFLVSSALTVFGDIKVREKQTTAGRTLENTTFIKGKRQRTETMNGVMITITQCDARRDIRINPTLKSYSITPFEEAVPENSASGERADASSTPSVKGGTVTVTTTIKDTGERKQIFGYTARRLLTNVVFASSPNACSVNNTRIETDGWYIYDNFGFDCGDAAIRYRMPSAKAGGGCRDRFVSRTVGTAKMGFAVLENTAIFSGDDEEGFRFSKEVVELSRTELDPALFDIPEGYSMVEDGAALFNPGYAGSSGPPRGASPSIPSMPLPTSPETSEPAAAGIGSKQEGVVRIGLAEMKVTAAGENISAEDLAVAFRNTLVDYLKIPGVEVVLLEAEVPSAVLAEAKQYECDFVIYGKIEHKKGVGGFGGVFGKVIAPAISSAGNTPTGSVAGNITAGAATSAVITAGSMAANVRSKDEMSLELRMVNSDGSPAVSRQYRRKARSNGEDLITPLVEEAASAAAAAAGK